MDLVDFLVIDRWPDMFNLGLCVMSMVEVSELRAILNKITKWPKIEIDTFEGKFKVKSTWYIVRKYEITQIHICSYF